MGTVEKTNCDGEFESFLYSLMKTIKTKMEASESLLFTTGLESPLGKMESDAEDAYHDALERDEKRDLD